MNWNEVEGIKIKSIADAERLPVAERLPSSQKKRKSTGKLTCNS